MKKFPDYKIPKWEKRKEKIINDMHYDYDEVDSLKSDYLNGKIDEVKYYSLLALCLDSLAEDEFIQGNYKKSYDCISKEVENFAFAVKLLSEGKDTKRVTRINIENKINGGYCGYLALVTSNYDVIPQVTRPDSDILQMLSHNIINQDTGEPIIEMMNAISLKDSKRFENALIKRIKEIRKFDIEHFRCMDVFSIGLIKEAQKNGLSFYCNYIEVDLQER